MKEKDKKQIKGEVIKEIWKSETELKFFTEAAKPLAPDNAYGHSSRMDALNNKVINDAALASKRRTLQRFENILAEIDSEKYGWCIRRSNTIAVERLKSIPYADFCITCTVKQG